jgi:hypothetical protein
VDPHSYQISCSLSSLYNRYHDTHHNHGHAAPTTPSSAPSTLTCLRLFLDLQYTYTCVSTFRFRYAFRSNKPTSRTSLGLPTAAEALRAVHRNTVFTTPSSNLQDVPQSLIAAASLCSLLHLPLATVQNHRQDTLLAEEIDEQEKLGQIS